MGREVEAEEEEMAASSVASLGISPESVPSMVPRVVAEKGDKFIIPITKMSLFYCFFTTHDDSIYILHHCIESFRSILEAIKHGGLKADIALRSSFRGVLSGKSPSPDGSESLHR